MTAENRPSSDRAGGRDSSPLPGRSGKHGVASAAGLAGVGVQFVVAVLICLYAGQWLDRRLGTSPLFLIIGVFLGAAASFVSMYRKLTASQREADADASRR